MPHLLPYITQSLQLFGVSSSCSLYLLLAYMPSGPRPFSPPQQQLALRVWVTKTLKTLYFPLQGVNCIAFSPLGHSDPGVINNGVLKEVAEELGKTPAQVRLSVCKVLSLLTSSHPNFCLMNLCVLRIVLSVFCVLRVRESMRLAVHAVHTVLEYDPMEPSLHSRPQFCLSEIAYHRRLSLQWAAWWGQNFAHIRND